MLSQTHLEIERCMGLNPSTLMPNASEGSPHSCLDAIAETVLPRADLKDQPFTNPDVTMFADGSSSKRPDGTNATGFAVVTSDKLLKSGKLPSHLSAQAAELIALTEACKLAKGQSTVIWTDSNYAFSTVHIFAQQWKNRGMITSASKPINHKQPILNLLDSIQLPKRLAVCKCAAHTRHDDPVSKGNQRADKEARRAALNAAHILSFSSDTHTHT